jgi:hypothetical protein
MKKSQAWIVEYKLNFMEHSNWVPLNELPPFQDKEIAMQWMEHKQKNRKTELRLAKYERVTP